MHEGDWPIAWDRLALLGHSLGGAVAIEFAHSHPTLGGALVLLAPVGDFLEVSLSEDFLAHASPLLAGTTPASLSKMWMGQAWEHNPVDLIPDLDLPILILQGQNDETVPVYVAAALAAANQRVELVVMAGADHEFGGHRPALAQRVAGWLGAWVGRLTPVIERLGEGAAAPN